jgi:hypothetical protein
VQYELSEEQAEIVMRGLATAVRVDGKLTDTQSRLLDLIGQHLIGTSVPVEELAPITPAELAAALSDEDLRRRVVHGMVTLEIIDNPLPKEVAQRVADFAAALHVDDQMLTVAKDYADGALDLARDDYVRNSYPLGYYASHPDEDPILHRSAPGMLTDTKADPALAARWEALEHCPSGSLGRAVWDFYQMRGFTFPGTPGAVDPLLAQHDWVHCLADYGTTALGEVEVFSFIAASIPDPSGFSYLVVILGLFETGNFAVVPGVATADPGHLETPDGPTRLADAIRRGVHMDLDVMGGVDWFTHADQPIDEVRAQLGVLPKSEAALAAGSLAALDPRAVFSHTDKNL